MVKGNITATQYPVEKILGNDFIFNIPRYQRPYAWTIKQAGELLDDLQEFIRDESDELAPYFMGTIILIEEKEKPNVEVVDGQQRLVTLTILLAVLRSLLPPSTANKLTPYLYEEADVIRKTQNRYRLRLRRQDADFFQKYIQEEGGIEKIKSLDFAKLSLDSQKNIHNNAHLFLNRLSSLQQNQLQRLASAIVLQCFLVVVTTSNIDSAYRIFSILNDRGLNISITDILKADLLSAVQPNNEEKYANKWEGAEEQLGRDKFEALFSYIRMIYNKTKLRSTVLADIRASILPKKNISPEQFIDDIVLPYTDALDIILNASYQGGQNSQTDSLNMLFKWLNHIDNSDWLPPAIFYLAHHMNDVPALLRFFTDLERLAAGQMILRTNINSRIERYGKVLTVIENKNDLYAVNAPLQLTTNERSEICKTLDGKLYLLPEIRLYVLQRLDELLAGSGATYEHKIITVEHVLPQNPPPNSTWLSWFPDENVREEYVHRLGNLVLLSRRMNSKAQNRNFEDKKETYFKTSHGTSPFALTTQVLGHTMWTPDIIDQRQQDLMKKLKNLWRLD